MRETYLLQMKFTLEIERQDVAFYSFFFFMSKMNVVLCMRTFTHSYARQILIRVTNEKFHRCLIGVIQVSREELQVLHICL